MDDNEKLKRHLIDLSRRASGRNMYTFSSFLSLPEQELYFQARKDFGPVKSDLQGGSETAERKIAVFGSLEDFGYEEEIPISVIEVKPLNEKFAEELTHRDYLGAILNLGIDRSLIGDIIIKEKNAWFFCLNSIAEFMTDSLTQVKHTQVRCTIVSDDIPELKPTFEEISVNVASERIDAIVAAFTHLSRGHASELFSREKVFINGKVTFDTSMRLKENDVLSIRGFGKAIYLGIQNETKKGRLYVQLKKYV